MISDAEILYTGHGDVLRQPAELEVDFYPGGEPLIDRGPRTGAVSPATIILRPTGLESFMAAMFWVDAMTERGHVVPPLILPSIPGARQDRLNPKGDYLFTVKSIAREINMRNFPQVITLDPHSDVGPALIDRCRVFHADEMFFTGQFGAGDGAPKFMGPLGLPSRHWDAVVAPDGGAGKRAGAVAAKLGIPLYHGAKKRDVATGKLSGFSHETVPYEGSDSHGALRLLFVDDICDGGGTFVGLAETFLPATQLDLYVSHGIFSQGTEKLLAKFDNVYTTNSIPGTKPGVEVIDAIDYLLEAAAS